MLKSNDLFKAVRDLKQMIGINRRKGSFRNYGSFYHPRKKYVSDIDIHYLLNVMNISEELEYIKKVIKHISEQPNLTLYSINVGHHPLYKKKRLTKKDLESLKKDGLITGCKLTTLIQTLKDYKNNSGPLLEHLLDDDLTLKWSVEEFLKGKMKKGSKDYNLVDSLKEDNFLWLDLVFSYGKKNIPMEFIIMPKKSFTDKEEKKKIYDGCKLAKIEYCCKKYYNFLKRIKACYGYNIKTGNFTKFMKEQYEELHQYFETIDKKISIYHMKIGELKINNKSSKLGKLEDKFNNIFKERATEYYTIGVKNKLIY